MAAISDLELAKRLVTQLNAHQSQGSLASQANDCWPIVQALGYYDLADHLRRMAENARRGSRAHVTTPENVECPDCNGRGWTSMGDRTGYRQDPCRTCTENVDSPTRIGDGT